MLYFLKKIPSSFHTLNLPPLFYCTAGLVLGILVASLANVKMLFGGHLTIPFIIISLIYSIAQKSTLKNITSTMLLVFAFFILGNTRYLQQNQDYLLLQKHVSQTPSDFIGTIASIAQTERKAMKQCVTIHLFKQRKSNEAHEWSAIDRDLQVYTSHTNSILVGDMVQIDQVKIKEPTNKSYRDYLVKENLIGTLFINNFAPTLIARPIFSFKRFIFSQKQRLIESLKKRFSRNTAMLYSSLFLGNKNTNKRELDQSSQYFKQWGISHYLARSGLHLVIFMLIWHALLRCIPLPFMLKQIILLMLAIIYFILTWPSISFVRAFYMFVTCKLCVLLKTRSHFLHVFSLTALTVLFLNPIQLFFLDFQLSFALTFALGWLNHRYYANKI
jgi:ComEC/Rec2-related protein